MKDTRQHPDVDSLDIRFSESAEELAKIGRGFYARGWLLGTSGNLSAVVSRDPLKLAITSSGVDKGRLTSSDILLIDSQGKALEGTGRPSAETLLHLTVVNLRGAGAVLHTHSVWSNILSDACFDLGGVAIEGHEMLKGLRGVETHEHDEFLPIIENSQDMQELAGKVGRALDSNPAAHGFLLRRHGLYTWGSDLNEAKRQIEILEYLLEVIGRTTQLQRH
jgi:methylthioribulose-1-phosphate dehydratase